MSSGSRVAAAALAAAGAVAAVAFAAAPPADAAVVVFPARSGMTAGGLGAAGRGARVQLRRAQERRRGRRPGSFRFCLVSHESVHLSEKQAALGSWNISQSRTFRQPLLIPNP